MIFSLFLFYFHWNENMRMRKAEKLKGEKLTLTYEQINQQKRNQHYGLVYSKCYAGVVVFFKGEFLFLCISPGYSLWRRRQSWC